MSNEVKTTTKEEEEALKALYELAQICYNKGVKDALKGTTVGVMIIAGSALVGIAVYGFLKDKKKTQE